MRHEAQEGFILPHSRVLNDILVPRYYDPRISERLSRLAATHTLSTISDLVERGYLAHQQGNYIPKIYYGSGPYPYIRTSDIVNFEIKASPKHGLPRAIYEAYVERQDVRPQDILFVHEGTYLIGSVAIVTAYDGPMLYQHHLDKFRVLPNAPIEPYFLLVALESSIVQSQIRSKQFSADIIDSIVGRVPELVIPIPPVVRLRAIEQNVRDLVMSRVEARERISHAVAGIDLLLRSDSSLNLDQICRWKPSPVEYLGRPAFLGGRRSFAAFTRAEAEIKSDILLPRYYDPQVTNAISFYEKHCKLRSIGELVSEGEIKLETGDEVGKISYGTGEIPFVRTSDLGSWELKRIPKQGVSQDIFEQWSRKQVTSEGDIFLVRDGTYLVGSSVLITRADLPLLYCGGIIKLTCLDETVLPSSLLLTLLNLPFVRRQMRNIQFTRDVIDTLGRRIMEVVLPIPRDPELRKDIAAHVHALLEERTRCRLLLSGAIEGLYPEDIPQ
jgi:hypothetical protein